MGSQELGQEFPDGEAEEVRERESAWVGVVVEEGRAGLPQGQQGGRLHCGSRPN